MIPTDSPEVFPILADYLEESDCVLFSQQVRQYHSQLKHNSKVKEWTRVGSWVKKWQRKRTQTMTRTGFRCWTKTRFRIRISAGLRAGAGTSTD